MWEMIERMASDRLWIYTGIVGSLAGAAFLFWFKDTRMALWAGDCRRSSTGTHGYGCAGALLTE